MAITVGRWERRDSADREAFGAAALKFCRTLKAREGVRGCRFFWTSSDAIAILSEAESLRVLDEPPTQDMAQALFALDDLARPTGLERWMDPRDGTEVYRLAGRRK